MDDRVYLTIPAEARYLSLARLAASGMCVGMDIDIDTLNDVRLLLTESCNLSFELGLKDAIEMVLKLEDHGIRFSVSGIESSAIEKDQKLQITAMIIESLADELDFKDDHIVVYKQFGA